MLQGQAPVEQLPPDRAQGVPRGQVPRVAQDDELGFPAFMLESSAISW
jgi:hypothetical protein